MTYRSEVVGSLLRPPELLEARQQYSQGRMNPVELKQLEDRAVDAAVKLQEECGIEVITDGEMRRAGFIGHFFESLSGFAQQGGFTTHWRDDHGNEASTSRPVVVEKLDWRRSMCAEEWVYLRSRKHVPGKVTLLSAQQAASYYDAEISKNAYPTREAYLSDVVDFTRREVAELIGLGCTYFQFDAPQYAALLNPEMRAAYRQSGSDPDKLIDLCIEMDNAIISGFPGITFAIHLCRGNNRSKYEASGDYEPIARVFEKTKFQRYFLEYDDERSGGFEPLRHMPGDREVVLGLISTKRAQMEQADELKARIEEASRFVGLERLALSPQCGFASVAAGNLITPEDQRCKLQLVSEVARSVWGKN